MRAIIIDDKDARALVESLQLAKLNSTIRRESESDTEFVRRVHAEFHYRVVVWLQDQGCNVTR